MREIDARVTGFDYTTFHAYTTEVEVDGCTWTLAIRYNNFYRFYTRLTSLEKHFTVEFPPKGGLFFSPPPEERQEQLDDFLLSTLAYFDMRGHPKRMEALLGELLQIPEHLGYKDDEEERTASEGSSVTEELLLDTPMPGHDHDDFLEDDDHDVQEDNTTSQTIEKNQVEDDVEVVQEELKAEVVEGDNHEITADLETKPTSIELEEKLDTNSPISEVKTSPVKRRQSQELTGGTVAKNYIAMLRRRTLVNGAIQAAVVSTMKENVEKSKATKVESITTGAPAPEVIPIEEERPAALKKPAVQTESIATKTGMEPTVVDTTVSLAEVTLPVPEEISTVEGPTEADLNGTEQDTAVGSAVDSTPETEEAEPEEAVKPVHQSSLEEEHDTERGKKEAGVENPVVSWFRRMSTFGLSSAEKDQHDAAATRKEQEEKEAIRAAAETKVREEADEVEAKAKRDAEAELLLAERLNLRLMPYRHPVFFQEFNFDVRTSCYSLVDRPSDDIVV